jgi:release factor glutamine methyltransferase
LLHELPPGAATVWMTDSSGDALDVARANAAGIGRSAAGARFAGGSWYGALGESLRGTLDVIVSNPPYIAADDTELESAVREWEPMSALIAGDDGLVDLREIVAGAPHWLRAGGLLVTEIGHTQASAVKELLHAAGLGELRVHRDLSGRDRFVSGVCS